MLLSPFISHPVAAQPTLDPGSRVRIYWADTGAVSALPQALIGRVSHRTPSALSVVPDRSALEVSVPLPSLLRIDVSAGRGTHAVAGGIIGGLISGGGFVALACAFANGSCRVGNQLGGFLAYYAAGAIPGAIVGVAVGSRIPGPERWRPSWVRPEARMEGRDACLRGDGSHRLPSVGVAR